MQKKELFVKRVSNKNIEAERNRRDVVILKGKVL